MVSQESDPFYSPHLQKCLLSFRQSLRKLPEASKILVFDDDLVTVSYFADVLVLLSFLQDQVWTTFAEQASAWWHAQLCPTNVSRHDSFTQRRKTADIISFFVVTKGDLKLVINLGHITHHVGN